MPNDPDSSAHHQPSTAAREARLSESNQLHARARALVDAYDHDSVAGESFDSLACDIARFQARYIPGVARLSARRGNRPEHVRAGVGHSRGPDRRIQADAHLSVRRRRSRLPDERHDERRCRSRRAPRSSRSPPHRNLRRGSGCFRTPHALARADTGGRSCRRSAGPDLGARSTADRAFPIRRSGT